MDSNSDTMSKIENPALTPLLVAATISVVAFSGIGVAAITGHLSITHASLNPFSSFSNSAASGLIQAPVIAAEGHQGLTRHRGETLVDGKPVNYKFGARIPSRKAVCPDCGVVDSIKPGQARPAGTGFNRTQTMGSEGATILKVGGQS